MKSTIPKIPTKLDLQVDQSVKNFGGLWLIAKQKDGYYRKISYPNKDGCISEVIIGDRLHAPSESGLSLKQYLEAHSYDFASYKTFSNESSMNEEWNQIIKPLKASHTKGNAIDTAQTIAVGILCAAIAHSVMSRDGRESNKLIVGASGLAGAYVYMEGRGVLEFLTNR